MHTYVMLTIFHNRLDMISSLPKFGIITHLNLDKFTSTYFAPPNLPTLLILKPTFSLISDLNFGKNIHFEWVI